MFLGKFSDIKVDKLNSPVMIANNFAIGACLFKHHPPSRNRLGGCAFYKLFKKATKSWRWEGERDARRNV